MVDTGGRATFLFVPEQFEAQLKVGSFYSERWMRDYFACEFHLIDGRWAAAVQHLFALTDGPFPEPYGMWHAPGSRAARVRGPSSDHKSFRERFEA